MSKSKFERIISKYYLNIYLLKIMVDVNNNLNKNI